MDSNHRRRSRRIYSPLHLAALQSSRWSWWSESNQQPSDYKSDALPLSHTSMSQSMLIWQFCLLPNLHWGSIVAPFPQQFASSIAVDPIFLHIIKLFSRSLTGGAAGRNRTTDTEIFSLLLYRLSYRGVS